MGMHDGHRKRLRNRFLTHGMDTLEDHEVLELLLFFSIHRQNTNELAHKLLDKFGSLAAVFDATLSDLMSIKGIGEQTAHLILLCKPLSRRYLIAQNNDRTPLNTIDQCAKYMMPYFFGAKEEHIYLLCLDAKARPICCRELSDGSATSAILPFRRATQIALDCNAVSAVLAHNHPGGNTAPSNDDYRVTAQFKETLESIGIHLVDHIVVSGNNYISIASCTPMY